MSDGNNSVILYQGSPLERIAASGIVMAKNKPLIKSERIFLASDIIVGQYGVTGFVLVDNKPENRWVSYTDGDRTRITWRLPYDEDEFALMGIIDEPYRMASHYINTSKGFKMIRYFILPNNVKEFFQRDRKLDEPLIEKCCEEGTLPGDFDEEKVNIALAFHGEERALVDRIIKNITPRFKRIGGLRLSWQDSGYHAYFSFHPWQHYKPVLEAGEESIVRAIKNFDTVLSRFDMNKRLTKRDLKTELAENYRGVLPPVE